MKHGNRKIYHLSHKDNFERIIKRGILSKNELIKKDIEPHDISLASAQTKRNIEIPKNKKPEKIKEVCYLHDFVPFFYRTHTPMSWSRKDLSEDLFFIVLDLEKTRNNDVINFIFTDGNAASQSAEFYKDWGRDSDNIDWYKIDRFTYWKRRGDSVIIGSEFLVHRNVPISLFEKIIIKDTSMLNFYEEKLVGINIPIVISPEDFPSS